MNDLTLELINKGHRFSCQYKNGLSNHLPMALMSLDCLGADASVIKAFYLKYSKILEPIQKNEVSIRSINKHFGVSNSFYSLVQFFDLELSKSDYLQIISHYLGILGEGISGAAFHPLIRLAFSIKIGDRKEIAHALASWVVSYQSLGGREHCYCSDKPLSLLESLDDLRIRFSMKYFKIEGNSVFRRMKSASEQKEFSLFYNSFLIKDDSIEEMANILIQLYLTSDDNFSALHAVTSCHALRVVSNAFGSVPKSLLRYYWEAIGSVYVDIGLIEIKEILVQKDLPSWNEIKQAACRSTNDHVIKLVFSCYEEYQYYKNPLYQLAASRKVKLVDIDI